MTFVGIFLDHFRSTILSKVWWYVLRHWHFFELCFFEDFGCSSSDIERRGLCLLAGFNEQYVRQPIRSSSCLNKMMDMKDADPPHFTSSWNLLLSGAHATGRWRMMMALLRQRGAKHTTLAAALQCLKQQSSNADDWSAAAPLARHVSSRSRQTPTD